VDGPAGRGGTFVAGLVGNGPWPWQATVTRVGSQPLTDLTTHQVAAALKVSDGTVRRWLEQGRIRGERVSGRWEIPEAELEMLLARERQARSWRSTDGTHTKAAVRRTAATTRLVAAAIRWRQNPTDPVAVAELESAIDERAHLTVKTSPGPSES